MSGPRTYELDSYFDNLIQAAPRPHIDWRLVATLACVVALGTAVGAYRGYPAAKVEAAAARAAWAPAELPREWRWERKTVAFDHMFRSER